MTGRGEKRYFVDLDESTFAPHQPVGDTIYGLPNDAMPPSHPITSSAIFLRSSSDEHEGGMTSCSEKESVSVDSDGCGRYDYVTDGGDHVTVNTNCILGHGRHSKVLGGRLHSSGQMVAIKQCYADEESTECGRREERILKQLQDIPGVIRLYDTISRSTGAPFRLALILQRASELPHGTTRRGPDNELTKPTLSISRHILPWARDLFTALAGAHEMGIIHGDIKPHNLLLDEQGHLLVTDWGTAMVSGSILDPSPGTLSYTAPELLSSPSLVHPSLAASAADIYSAGVTLYTLSTGRDPFAAGSRSGATLVIAIRQGFFAAGHNPWPSPQKETEQEPTAIIQRLVEACVRTDPRTRPTALQALDLLNDANKFNEKN